MRVLITGADGLLGTNLVRELLDLDFSIRVLVHPSSTSKTLDGLAVKKYFGDILDRKILEKAAKNCEAIFHLAASTALWPPRDPKITAINVVGTRNMLHVAERCGIRRFIHVGSASSFGYGTLENPGTEKSPFCYQRFGLAYFHSKLRAQKLVLDRSKEGRLDGLVVNPTFMFGPYDSAPSSGKMVVKFAQLQPRFYPPGGRNFVYVRDVARGMISALEKGRSGQCYILGNQNLEMREIFDMLSHIVGISAPNLPIPKAFLYLAGMAGSTWSSLTASPPLLSFEMAKSACLKTYYSSARALKELDFPQTPIETALKEAYHWLKENYYITK